MTIEYDELYSREQFAADDPRLPETFQVYRVNRKIGQGLISFVYEARRLDSKEIVRLKVLRKRIANLNGIRERVDQLDREYQIYHGDHILGYNGLGRHDDNIYFEFDYTDAVSLRSLIDDDAPFHPDLVAMIALGIIEGLTEVHGAKPSPGMGNLIPLHRNLTPENILLAPKGKVVLCDIDMGLISTFAEKAGLELPYTPLCFEAPERLLRDYADRRSDIFSLGMVMMEMACKRLLYVGYSIHHTRQNIRDNKREKSSEMFPRSHSKDRDRRIKQLAGVIEQLIAHKPENRIDQLVQLESQLLKYLEGTRYREFGEEISEFMESRSFVSQRSAQRGFWRRLTGN